MNLYTFEMIFYETNNYNFKILINLILALNYKILDLDLFK